MQVQVAERASYATKHKFMRPISPKQALMCAATGLLLLCRTFARQRLPAHYSSKVVLGARCGLFKACPRFASVCSGVLTCSASDS